MTRDELTTEARELIAAADRGDVTFWSNPAPHYRMPGRGSFYGQAIYGPTGQVMNGLVAEGFLEVGDRVEGYAAHSVAVTARGRAAQ
jgi:hypothetical protein